MDMLEYLCSLTEEQLREAIKAISQEERIRLASTLCRKVNEAVVEVIKNKDKIWENR